MADNNKGTTTVDVTDDIATLLAQPGADNIMTPATGDNKDDKKPNLFSRKATDLSFIDKPDFNKSGKSEEEIAAEKAAAEAEAKRKLEEGVKNGTLNPDGSPKNPEPQGGGKGTDSLEDILNESGAGAEEGKGTGRPKMDKDALYELTKKLIESKKLVPFDDDKPLEKYTLADYEELFEANEQYKADKLQKEIPVKFFDSLPDKLKSAAAYVANGGTDLKGMFKHLAEYEETLELDDKNERGQEEIVRRYLQSTKFGTADEIEEQLNEWRDQEILEKKAGQFKPKLDAMQEQYIAFKVQEAENLRKQQQEHAENYMKSVYSVLEPGELNGLKLDKKVQSMLYAGLVQPNYPSVSGKNTNLLGHLLEKYQFVEPNHGLIAEVLYHLADPDGFKAKIKEQGKTAAVAETVRNLKTEERKKIASSQPNEDDERNEKTFKIPRPGAGFFKR